MSSSRSVNAYAWVALLAGVAFAVTGLLRDNPIATAASVACVLTWIIIRAMVSLQEEAVEHVEAAMLSLWKAQRDELRERCLPARQGEEETP
ncbi:hypothetical protein CR983_03225 [Candidatus Saccharibacteria bacterium]|nr:MAG: hypothetical protein CR983_03225 [Candidatus Saccharibacteria bacterium]